MKLIAILIITLTLSACATTKKTVQEEFTVDLDSPQINLGEVEIQFDRFLGMGGLKKENIAVSYFPREDAICLLFRIDFTSNYQFWSKNGREAFITALENYKKDYDERSLARNSKATRRKYGVTQGYLIWQMSRYTVQARANMDVELGHNFKDRSPYFTIYQREAKYIDPIARDNNRESQEVMMYFTRAQADELAAIFDPQYIQGIISGRTGGFTNQTNIDVDDY